MASRRKSRERALQILYTWDVRHKTPGYSLDDTLEGFYETLYSDDEANLLKRLPRDKFMESLIRGAIDSLEAVDKLIQAHSEHWRIERMPTVDRNLLRLATYELTKREVAPAVIIDEALELARRFSGDEAVGFVNGVLDAVHKDLEAQQPPAEEAPASTAD